MLPGIPKLAVSATLVGWLVAGTAAAERLKPPCTGCTLDAPTKASRPLPLLVVLHGDRERADVAAARWRAAASKRGWAVLALQCPKETGCKDSFWQWNGEPSWVHDQVIEVGKRIAIDPERIALAGWSGGASYIGLRAQAWSGWVSGVVIHGGGMAPMAEGCATPTCPRTPRAGSPDGLPAYFLVGDKNPLHQLAKDLRAHFDGCTQDVVWDLVRGGDHDREDRALDVKKAAAILDWLNARPLTRAK